MFSCFSYHAHDPACKGFTEHESSSSRFQYGFDCGKNFVRPSSNVRREDDAEVTTSFASALDTGHRGPCPLLNRRVIEIGIEVFILLYKKEQRTAGCFLNQFANLVRSDSSGWFENRAECRLLRCKIRNL